MTLKSRREIALMRKAGRVVAEAHHLAAGMMRPGVTTGEIDVAIERLFAERDAVPLFKGFPGEVPFPAVTCISVNEEVVHGIPGDRELREGDLVSVDTGCRVDGWCGDAAWTYPVGPVSPLDQRLLDVGQAVLKLAIDEIGRRRYWSEVAALMEQVAKEAGFSVVEEMVGHGIGRDMHEDPQVPNYVSEDLRRNDILLEPGLVLAIEPMLNAGSSEVGILPDHWTIATVDGLRSVHFEQTVALTGDAPEVLTAGVGRRGFD